MFPCHLLSKDELINPPCVLNACMLYLQNNTYRHTFMHMHNHFEQPMCLIRDRARTYIHVHAYPVHILKILIQIETHTFSFMHTCILIHAYVLTHAYTYQFERSVCAYKDIVEAAAAKADAECRASMMQHFTRCCQLEWMFWDAALQLQSWPKFENSN